MPSLIKKLFTITSVVLCTISFVSYSSAAELNIPGFTGSANSTVTTGFSARLDRDCESVRGYKRIDDTTRTFVNNGGYGGTAIASSSASTYLTDGEGCAKRKMDGYGNSGDSPRDYIGENADDGNMNFDGGDIFDATTRVFTEITGTTDAGVGVNLSLVGSYNAIDSFTNPVFKPFTAAQLDNIESDIDLLNAYITTDYEDVSITAGRFVTNWGESTFIPVGMNGLTTNALDLVSLRVPGASIKEALIPTEQISIEGFLGGGWSFEGYYQFNDEHIEIDEAGTFFGSEVASKNGDKLIFSGSFGSHTGDARNRACGYLIAVGDSQGCNATTVAAWNAGSNATLGAQYLMGTGLGGYFTSDNAASLIAKAGILGYGAAASFGGSAGDIHTLAAMAPGGVAGVLHGYQNWDEYTKKGGKKIGVIELQSNGHMYADGEDQYGFALRTYLDEVGTGVDIGFYFTQYDSKVPYIRYKGQRGIYAGDLFGAFTLASASGMTEAGYLSNLGSMAGTGAVTLNETETAGKTAIGSMLGDLAFGSGACGAYMNPHLVNDLYNDGRGTSSSTLYTSEEKANALDAYLYTEINGELYFDSTKCATLAGVFSRTATLQGAAALLGAAITPLNLAEYEFMYPENLQAMGVSMNTNIGSTTVQAELTYRPDHPLHTAPAEQGQQLSDAVGATQLLTMGVIQGMAGSFATALASYQANVDPDGTSAEMITNAGTFKRSNLPAISLATVAAGDFYTTPYFEYDVISGTIGTTSTFTASHPATAAMGADGTVLLTELGFVSIPDLTDTKPINRGGYRDGVGGAKCGGANLAGTTFNAIKALDGATHLASSQTDPLFGNGSYCESKNNADDFSMTYRLVGIATYNNFQNTAWTFSPSVVWSHDFHGYGPTTLGGFVPGRQSLSLTSNFSNGDMNVGLSYVNQLGDEMDNLSWDRDYISANVSYAF